MKSRPHCSILSLFASSLTGLAALALFLAPGRLHAATGTWNADLSGNWSDTSKWTAGTIADGSGFIANFTNDITTDRTVTLDGAHTITTVVFGDAATGTAGAWTLSGANTLTLAGTTPGITVNTLGGTKTATVSSVIAGSAGLVKAGTGTLVLSGVNTYTGATTVNAGTLNVTSNVSAANGSWLVLGTGGTLATTANFNTGSTISVASGGSIQLGATSASGGTSAQALAVVGSVTNAGSLLVGRSGSLTLNSPATWTQSGAASLTAQGGGVATMTVNTGATFTYTGTGAFGVNSSTSTGFVTNLNVTAGTFVTGRAFNNSAALIATTSSNVVLNNGGSVKLSASVASLATTAGGTFNFQVGATGTGGTINTNGFDTTLALPITNVTGQVGKLVKIGTGTLTLSGTNTYTGGTTLSNSSGVLAITSNAALGTGTVSLVKGGIDTSVLQLSNNITVANAFSFASANLISGTGFPHIENVSGNNTLTGNLTLITTGGNGMNLVSDAGLLTISGNIGCSQADASRTYSFGGAGNGLVSGIISNNSATNTVGMEKLGTGTWTFTGTNTVSGNFTVRGGTMLLGNNAALGGSPTNFTTTAGASILTNGAFSLANSIRFNANPATGTNILGGNTDNTSTFSGAIALAGDGTISQVATTAGHVLNLNGAIGSASAGTHTLTFAGPGAITVGGAISNGSAGTTAVTVSGGTVILAGACSYTGNTRVTSGSLSVSAAGLDNNSSVEVSSGATFDLNFTGSDVVTSLTFDGTPQATGTWGAIGSLADHTDARFTGTGLLLVVPTYTWNSIGGDGLFSTSGNWNLLTAPTPNGILTFPAGQDTFLKNDLTAGTAFTSLRFLSGADTYTISGNAITLATGIDNLSTSPQIIGLPIAFGGNLTFLTSTGSIGLTGDLSGGFGFTKTGTGSLDLSGTNTYTGPATLAAGTLHALTAGALPAASAIAFTNTGNNVTLDITGLAQTVAGLSFGTQTTGTVTILGDTSTTLTSSPAALTFAPGGISGNNLTVDMSTLGAFTYNNPSGNISLQTGFANITGSTTVTLSSALNSITAGSLNLGALSGGSGSGNPSTINLGLTNTLNVNSLNLGGTTGRSTGVLQFASSAGSGASLKIRNAAGTGAANLTIAKNGSFGDATVYGGTLDTTANGGTLDALIGTLVIGNAHADGASGRGVNSTGTFKMGAGTLTATSAIIGYFEGVTPTGANNYNAIGLLSLSAGGTTSIGTISLAQDSLGVASLTGTNKIDGQITLAGSGAATTLNATTIQQGTLIAGETTRTTKINWNDGTIGNIATTDLAVSGVAVILTGTTGGSHTFNVTASHTATVSSVISSSTAATPLTKTGPGTLILSGVNTYTGDTTVSAGTLSATHAFLNDSYNVEIATTAKLDLNFAGTDIVASLTFDGVAQATGTTYGATGSGAAHIDDVHFSGTGKLQVGVITDPFAGWASGFGLTGSDALKSADPDHDGRSNLLEFALNGNPTTAANDGKMRTAVATVPGGDTTLTLTLPVRTGVVFTPGGDLVGTSDSGTLEYKIQGSTDLADFVSANVTEVTPALSSLMPTLDPGWEYRTFRLPGTVTTNPRGFLRAFVTDTP